MTARAIGRFVGPSITYWVRGEPDPRSDATDALVMPLQARVRDPMWFLTRQWQFGEFEGADSGSPAYVALTERSGRLTGWAAAGGGGGGTTALTPAPIEAQTEREAFTPDVATRVELGQVFEQLLAERGQVGLVGAFRGAYAVSSVADDPADLAEVQFRAVVGDRAIDGVALAQAIAGAAPGLPAAPVITDAAAKAAVLLAIEDFQAWITATIGSVGTADPMAWAPAQLAYAFNVAGSGPSGQTVSLVATPGVDGLVEWYALDLANGAAGVAGVPEVVVGRGPAPTTRAIIPAHVRFRGMPNARFWDFEIAGTDLGSIIPDKRDVARLAIMDFVMLHANDWFVVPIDMAPGDLHQIDELVVHDVFGVNTTVGRADREAGSVGQWTMFTTTVVGQTPSTTADFFVLPPTAATAIERGTVVEAVEFARDDIANMVWALEQTTENAVGAPWPGHERDIAHNVPAPGAGPPPPTPGVPLRYGIQDRVPEYWIPFLPVSIDPAAGSVALERAAMLRDDGTPIEPAGRILRPSSLAGSPYRVPEEVIAPTGVRVERIVARCRGVDGSTALWVMRQRGPGTGEVNSALRFDQALEE